MRYFLVLLSGSFILNCQAQHLNIDFSSVNLFWSTTESLKKNSPPTEKDWNRFFNSTYYAFYFPKSAHQTAKELFSIAFMPNRKNDLDSIKKSNSWQKFIIEYLISCDSEKEQLEQFQKVIDNGTLLKRVLNEVQRYLPKGTIEKFDNPKIAFGFYQPDANGGKIIAMDLKLAKDCYDYNLIIAHEAHHYYMNKIRRKLKEDPKENAYPLIHAISQIHLEGIADLIDKEAMLESRGKGLPKRTYDLYLEHYSNPTVNLIKVDSLLKVIYHDPGSIKENGKLISEFLPLSAHPHGYFLAKTILDEYGIKGVIKTVTNPFQFIRTYNRAARKNKLFHFSKQAVRCLKMLERSYLES